jgi:acetylornithine aminotransferase
MTHLSPAIRAVEPYPFEELDRRKKEAVDAGRRVVDFGVGDPREETPALVRDALKEAIGPVSSYPRAAGLPALRRAIAAWADRRYGAAIDADSQILPTLGSKELVFSLAQAVLDPAAGKDLVLTTAPGYPIPERGARYAGGDVQRLRLIEERGFLPDLAAITDEQWTRASLLWLNYPNNPTGAVAPLSFLAYAAERCRAHDVLLASDEAYSELWFDAPPASALQVADRSRVVVFQTLSKRSSMTGYRSGFVAAPPEVIAALKAYRPTVGTAPQEFVQRASIVAWTDERHVEETRARYAAKRDVMVPALAKRGFEIVASEATMYLWVAVPDAETLVEQLLERGVLVSPGSFFGPSGEGYVRFALVPTLAECERAAAILAEL